jgi:diguanylate cyclase (GGDEF)-like protein
MELQKVFESYPNPFYIIEPIVHNGKSEDFTYIYVNQAFCFLVGHSKLELVGHRYLEVFQEEGERQWLDLFAEVAEREKHVYIEETSTIIHKVMYTEAFHIEPGLCGCIIHDFKNVMDDMKPSLEWEMLRRKAYYDYLTGFYNRFYLRDLSDRLDPSEPVGVTFLDINNLKWTNDNFGHAAGDALICRVANMIRIHYRGSLFFRIGGDEFLVVSLGMDREEFMEMSMENGALFGRDKLVAMGYQFYEHVEDLEICIDQCDELMYRQKRQMKHRVQEELAQ